MNSGARHDLVMFIALMALSGCGSFEEHFNTGTPWLGGEVHGGTDPITGTGTSTETARNITIDLSFTALCSSYYTNAARVGTAVVQAPGVFFQLYAINSLNAQAPLYSVIGNLVPVSGLPSAMALRSALMASGPLHMELGALADGNYLISLCSSDSIYQSSCQYLPGDTIVSRSQSSGNAAGTGLLLVGNATSSPIVLNVSNGVGTLIKFGTPTRYFYPMSLLVGDDGCY